MSRGRLYLVHGVIVILLLGHAYDIARQQEHWPFSNYPMWARLSTEWHVRGVAPVGLTDDSPPEEVDLMNEAYFAPMPLQYQRLKFRAVARGRRVGERDKVLGDYLRHYEKRRAAGLHDGPPLVGIRLYERYWTMSYRATNAAAPDRTTLLYEYHPNRPETRPAAPSTNPPPTPESPPRAD